MILSLQGDNLTNEFCLSVHLHFKFLTSLFTSWLSSYLSCPSFYSRNWQVGHWYVIISFFKKFILTCMGPTPSSSQDLILPLCPGISFIIVQRDHMGCHGLNLGWPCARNMPYLLYYLLAQLPLLKEKKLGTFNLPVTERNIFLFFMC